MALSDLDLHDMEAVRAELCWAKLSRELLDGLTHALGNRLGTLAALGEYLESDTGGAGRVGRLLGEECTRLAEALRLLRLLPAQGARPAEPLSTAECLDDAIALLQYHPGYRDVTLSVTGATAVPAVHGRRTELRRALTLLLFAAASEGRLGQSIALSARHDESGAAVIVSLPAEASASDSPHSPWTAAATFARLAGAELREAELRVPVMWAAGEGAR